MSALLKTDIDNFKHIFYRWLKDNGCYLTYNKELKLLDKTVESILENVFKKHYLTSISKHLVFSQIITYSFTWSQTRQGDKYWSSLYVKFREYYNDKLNEYRQDK